MAVVRFFILLIIKLLSCLFFRVKSSWVGNQPQKMKNIRVGVLLNHTSLFEPLYLAVFPVSFLWKIAKDGNFAGADVTMNRPIVGFFFRLLAPQVVTITRKRDDSWKQYLETIHSESLILIAPEGRMKRPTGLDKDGKPMTVRGGIVDVLEILKTGTMLIGYSGGLHHIHAPGQGLPKLFQKAVITFETIDIAQHLSECRAHAKSSDDLRQFIIKDLESRRDTHC